MESGSVRKVRCRERCWRGACGFVSTLAAVCCLGASTRAAELHLVERERFDLAYPAFVEPVAVATGPLGQLYVADSGRGTVLRLGPEARIEYEFESPDTQPGIDPLDLEVTGFQVFVLDALSKTLLRFTLEGSVLDVLQNFAENSNGFPAALSVDGSGRVLVAYPNRHAVHIVDETQEAETIIGGFGTSAGELSRPIGVAFAPDGSLYVADAGNHRVQHFDEVGNYASTLAAAVEAPRGVTTGADGLVFVADAAGAVHAFTTRLEDGHQHVVLDLPANEPVDLAVHGDTLWVLSRAPHRLLRVQVLWGE